MRRKGWCITTKTRKIIVAKIKIKKEWTSASTWYAVANADGKSAAQMAAAAKIHAKKYPRNASVYGVTFYVEFSELFGNDRGANRDLSAINNGEKQYWFRPQTKLAKELVEKFGGEVQLKAHMDVEDCIFCDGFTVASRGKGWGK